MKKANGQPSSLTRRSFVKASAGAAVLGGGAALVGCSQEKKADPEPEKPVTEADADPVEPEAAPFEVTPVAEDVKVSYCRGYCTNNCSLDIHLIDGKPAYATAHESDDPRFTRICLKGHAQPLRAYSKERLLKPLRRTGERGEGKWEEISWDEAVNEVVTNWKAITDEHGPGAMCFYKMAGNRSTLNGDGKGSVYSRFTKATGCTTLSVAVDCATSYALGRQIGLGFYLGANSPTTYKDAKTILIWGANPAVSQLHNMHFLLEAKEGGTKLIMVDPVFNATAAVCDQFVPVRPGSDGALAFGMMQVVLENGWQDTEFLRDHSVAPFLVKESDGKFLRLSDLGRAEAGAEDDAIVVRDAEGNFDTSDNIADPMMEGTFDTDAGSVTCAYTLLLDRIAEYPLSRVVELTGIDEATIRQMAADYADPANRPSTIYTFFGVDHYYNAHWSAACMGALGILTGNVGKRGAFVGVGEFRNPTCFNAAWATDVPAPENPGKGVFVTKMAEVVNDYTYNGEPYEIHGMYCCCGNPVGNVGNRNNTLDWLNKLDFICVADVVMSETAEYADVVLPASYWFECEDMMGNSSNSTHLNYGEKMMEPMGDSKPDFEIYRLLAEGLGIGEHFQLSTSDYLKHVLDTDECRSYGIDYDTLVQKKVMECAPIDYVLGEGGIFPTPTKRAEFYLEAPKASNDDSRIWDVTKERLPYWEPPREVYNDSEIAAKYPFMLLSEHNRHRTHTQWFDVEPICELDGEPLMTINQHDADALGIKAGDTVRVFNDRGSLTIKCVIKNNLPDGMVSIPKGYTAAEYIEGHLSDLTPCDMNPFCGNQPFFDCAVAIEKK